jgi:capsular exopolysaccharide synthesis family protein
MSEESFPDPTRSPSLAGVIRRRWLAILIPLIVIPGAALAISLTAQKQYEAQTSLLFRDTGAGTGVLASEDPQREATTNLRLLQLGVLDDRVEAKLGEPFNGSVDVTAEADSNLATITVTDEDPKTAARVANLYAQEFISLRRKTASREIQQELDAVRSQIAQLTPEELAGPEGEALQDRERQLAVGSVAQSGTQQVSEAQVPTSPSSPKPLRNTAFAIVVGLVIGALLAIFFERRDRRIRDSRDLEAAFGRPIVGRIPKSRELARAKSRTEALTPPDAEAFRSLRANLTHVIGERPTPSVLITSANPREGKTTISWNLARAAAISGSHVLLIEADLRRPVLAQSLNFDGAPGLTQLLSGSGSLSSLVKTVEFTDMPDGETDGRVKPITMDLLVAGSQKANPTELLDSGRMASVLDRIPDSYDLVVVDTPPVGVVSDALPMLDLVDGVIVVGRLGVTTFDAVGDLSRRLATLDARVAGVVVNGDTRNEQAYGYYQAPRRH